MVQGPVPRAATPRTPAFRTRCPSSRPVLARRCSRDYGDTREHGSLAPPPTRAPQPGAPTQKPSTTSFEGQCNPRVILRPAFDRLRHASRCSRPAALAVLGSSFLRGWRSMPGSMPPQPANSLGSSSTTAMIVLSWSRATQGPAQVVRLGHQRTPFSWLNSDACAISSPPPHTISPLEEDGFEPSSPVAGRGQSRAKSDLQDDNRAEAYVRLELSRDRLCRRAPEPATRETCPPPPFLFRHRGGRRGA